MPSTPSPRRTPGGGGARGARAGAGARGAPPPPGGGERGGGDGGTAPRPPPAAAAPLCRSLTSHSNPTSNRRTRVWARRSAESADRRVQTGEVYEPAVRLAARRSDSSRVLSKSG